MNKIAICNSNTVGLFIGISPSRLYKENHFRYYKDGRYLLEYEEYEE